MERQTVKQRSEPLPIYFCCNKLLGENASTNIAEIVLPIVGVIAVICVIVVIIVWRRSGLIQSLGRNPSSAKRNQQRVTEVVDARPKQSESFDNPEYDNCQQLEEIVGF